MKSSKKSQKSEKMPLVGIIIVNWNKKEMTGNCLKTLKMTTYKNFIPILVDNGSDDDSVEYLKKIWPKMHVIKLDKNYGYTMGTNIGWKYAMNNLKADYICAMDNDIITVQPEWLSLIIEELEKDKERGIGSGKHLFPDGRLQTPYVGADDSYKMDTGKYDFIKEVDAFVGPAILIKRKVIETIGYYDENFFYGPNDIDYCLRARKKGFKIVYNGLSKSIHIGSSSGRSPKKDLIYRHQCEGTLIFTLRYGSSYEKVKMILRQFIRAFMTRIDPVAPQSIKNTLFHLNFPKRLFLYLIGTKEALKNYKHIKSNTELEKKYL